MAYDLSPYPSVILALEGPTEIEIVPRAMETLGIPNRPSFIRVFDSGSESKDHGFLARYAAMPSLGSREGDVAGMERPPTRYLVVVDGDRHFFEPAKREKKRKTWVSLLWNSLPAEYRTDTALAEVDSLVLLEVWADGLDFERAHFTDAEIAEALAQTGLAPASASRVTLERDLADARTERRPLDAVWASWP